jgi:hypothetical protein
MTGRVTFVWHGVNAGIFKLKEPQEPKQKTLYDKALAANKGNPSIKFRKAGTPTTPKSTFSTDDLSLVQVLRSQKGSRRIVEDLSALPVKCPYKGCEFTAKGNTQEDQLLLATHFIEVHGGNDADNADGDAK